MTDVRGVRVIDPLFVDTYSEDLNGRTPQLLPTLINAGPPWHGWWGKVSEGDWYQSPSAWLQASFTAAKATDRLAKTWWYGGYLYANFARSWQASADLFLKAFAAAGGDWTKGSGALNPCIDAESADNSGCTAAQVTDHMTELINYLRKQTGREVWVYGATLMYDLGLKTDFGADGWEIPRYTATLPQEVETRIGIDPKKVIDWQYDGDGQGFLAGYPTSSPIGPTDISACIINGGGANALQYLVDHC